MLPGFSVLEPAVEHPVAGAAQADELQGLVKVLMVSVNDPLVLTAHFALLGFGSRAERYSNRTESCGRW